MYIAYVNLEPCPQTNTTPSWQPKFNVIRPASQSYITKSTFSSWGCPCFRDWHSYGQIITSQTCVWSNSHHTSNTSKLFHGTLVSSIIYMTQQLHTYIYITTFVFQCTCGHVSYQQHRHNHHKAACSGIKDTFYCKYKDCPYVASTACARRKHHRVKHKHVSMILFTYKFNIKYLFTLFVVFSIDRCNWTQGILHRTVQIVSTKWHGYLSVFFIYSFSTSIARHH
jgi:hypothetical protein